jgi:predicted ATPase/DNA-binding CsgD family transcriptional regulator
LPNSSGQGNVPSEIASFVGRRLQLRQARQAIGKSRLVTLAGAGGVGKTRLALRLAHDIRHIFSGGVWWADLTDVPPDPGAFLVEQYIASAFNLAEYAADRPKDVLVRHLIDRHCLLIVDNCEHVRSEIVDLSAELLRASAKLHILATSREILGVVGEHVLQIPPLTLTETTERGRAPGGEALELLRQRASAAGVKLADSEIPSAVDLCRRLDGLPLAIELAAGQLIALSLLEVLARLEDRLLLLTRSSAYGPPAHQSLRAVLEWSYGLCDERERVLWERIAVFSGGFDLIAAEEICSDESLAKEDVLDAISGLVRQSLVIVSRDSDRSRYRFLETVRQYGLEMLTRRGEDAVIRGRHRNYFSRMVAEASGNWYGENELNWLRWGRIELPNIRTAIEFSFANGELTTGATLTIGLGARLWIMLGWLGEGQARLERILALDLEKGDPLRVLAVCLSGYLAVWQGDAVRSKQLLSDAQAAVIRTDSHHTLMCVDLLDGMYALLIESDSSSINTFSNVLESCHTAGISEFEALGIEHLLSMAVAFLGDRHSAIRMTQSHLEHSVQRAARVTIPWAQWCLGLAHVRHGDSRRALTVLRESLRTQLEICDWWGTVCGAHAVTWALAAELKRQGRDAERDPEVAEQICRLVGGLKRLREQPGMRLTGLGSFNSLTLEAESVAQKVLSEDCSRRAVEHGKFAELDIMDAYNQIISLAMAKKPMMPTGDSGTSELMGESDAVGDRLTTRELQVVPLIAQGLTNSEIARKLTLSVRTVETHVGNILRKLACRNRQEISVWYANLTPARKVDDTDLGPHGCETTRNL